MKYVKTAKKIIPPATFRFLKKTIRSLSLQHIFLSFPRGVFPGLQYPSALTIMLTSRCNLSCVICRRESLSGSDFPFGELPRLENAIKYAHSINLTGFGEPLLYPRLKEVIGFIARINPKKELIQITTNGTLLSEKIAAYVQGNLRSLTISLNAARPETYGRDTKNGDFPRTLSNVRKFFSALSAENREKVSLHFVASAKNFREIPDYVLLADDLGIKTISIGHYLVGRSDEFQHSLFLIKNEFAETVKRARSLGRKKGISVFVQRQFFHEKLGNFKHCDAPFAECLIDENGGVLPCCFLGGYRIGNVFQESFESIWFGEKYRQLRKRRSLPACGDCSELQVLDDVRAHFTSTFKEGAEYKKLMDSFSCEKTE